MPLITLFFFFLTQASLFCSLCLSRTYCFPKRQNRISSEETRWNRRVEDEYRMSVGAYVLLVNGTFIWPVTFSCSRIVYCRRNLFVWETLADPPRPHIILIYCVISCTRCFFLPWPYDFLFASQYTHYFLTFSPSVYFFFPPLSFLVCLCVPRHR